MDYSWQFNKMRPSDKAREPIQGEFFAADSISNPGEALIREGIQNSLDAGSDGEKVVVRIRICGKGDAVARTTAEPFLNGLGVHLKAPGNGLREVPDDDADCPILVFEDFGTTGLEGDTSEWKPTPGSRNHFYHFFRAEGRSDKGEKDIGRWGVGKQVFPRASRINCIFGLTVRKVDQKKLLMGMAVLKSHDVSGTRFAPDGWLGRSQNGEELVLPIEDKDYIEEFSRTFDVQRINEPGLSIVVPWCDFDFTDINLVRAVLRGYFWPILNCQLEVFVETASIETILDKSSLDQEIKKIGGDLEQEILPLVELARWATSIKETDYLLLNKAPGGQWSKDVFPGDVLDEMRKRYEQGERIAIRVPVQIKEKNQPARQSYFHVFLHRDGSEQSGRPIYIREGIIIPDVRRYGSGALRGVRSIVLAEDAPVAAFLGDSENPAHTQWQKDSTNFKGKYHDGPRLLDFIIRSPIEIVRLINEQDKKVDPTLLVDLFSIPVTPEQDGMQEKDKKKPEKPGKDPERPVVPPPPPLPKPFLINRIDGGFIVANVEGNRTPPSGILIRAAYHVRKGNPFKKYRPADFVFGKNIKMELSGAGRLETKDNTLKVKIDSSDFKIRVTGFDPKRDVRVEAKVMEDDNVGSDT